MGWNRWYVAKSYLRSSLWIVPLVALVLELLAIRGVFAIDAYFQWVPHLATTVAGTTGVMETVITLTVSFIVFTFGSILIAIQVASGQLTPRIIATTLLRDNTIRATVGLFVFTLLFAAGTNARIDTEIPYFVVTVAFILGIASVTAFLFLIDYTARLLRPITIVSRIGEQGIRVIESVYPDVIEPPHVPRPPRRRSANPGRTIEHHGRSAIVLAVNVKALVAHAQKADGVIEFVPRVGDFVATGEPLFRLYGGAKRQSVTVYGPDAGRIWSGILPHRAGFGVCVSGHCRRGDQGAVEGDQRSDHRHPRDRPVASPAAPGRPASPARRRCSRCRWNAQADSSYAELGRLCETYLQ